MKYLLIASIVLVLVIAGIFGVNAYRANSLDIQTLSGCGSCNGGCTAESNCGLAPCGAANGGECTCGKTAGCNGSCTATSSCGSAGCGAKTGSGCGCKN